jgi:uncharacterized protein YbjT (DUF2867 family)
MSSHFPRVLASGGAGRPAAAPPPVLVTGASGSVGSQLVPRLLRDGYPVRALGRDPMRVAHALATGLRGSDIAEVEVLRGDVLSGEGLAHALRGVQVAYYLIHSMEHSAAGSPPFAERERVSAENFTAAAAAAGVGRIVYLGGLQPRASEAGEPAHHSRHLASRAAVERILLEGIPDSVALRASIVIGSRSRSFRFLVRLVERMRVLTLPAWHRFRTQPIDARDITEMLARCATADLSGRSLDVGGPDVLTYGEMITAIADLLLVNRPALHLGVSATAVAGRVAAAIANEDPALVVALMEGLGADLLPADERAEQLLGVQVHSFASAVEHALGEWEETEPLRAR